MAPAGPDNLNGQGLRVLLGEISETVAVVDASCRIVITNDSAATGDPDQVLGLESPGAERFRPAGRRYEWRDLPLSRAVLTGEVVCDEECFRMAADGVRFSLSCRAAPIRDEMGEITGGVLVERDITQERRSAGDLQAARAHADEILERISDMVFAVDRRWRYTYLNRRALERVRQAVGRDATADELVGQSCWEVFPEWASSPIRDAFERSLHEQRPVHVETYVPAARSWFDVRLYPSASGLSVYLCDITERHRATEQLAYQARLLENVEDAVVATDPQGTVTAWNGGAERLFGWSGAEAVGRPVTEVVVRAEPVPPFTEAARGLALTGRHHAQETRCRRDGTHVATDEVTLVLRDDSGRVTGYLGIARDVTEARGARREAERRLAQQAAVADLGQRALRDDGIPALLGEAAGAVRRGLEIEYSRVDELLPGARGLRVRAGEGWPPGVVGSVLGAGRDSVSGYALLTGQPVIVDDTASQSRFAVSGLARAHHIRSEIAVVIDPLHGPFGVLVALATHSRAFSEQDVSFMQSVANVLADSIDRAVLRRRLATAREAERSRIARDLHDEALRELSDVIALAALSRRSGHDQDEQSWNALMTGLHRVGRQLRAAIHNLTIAGHEERPFADLLADVVSAQAELAGATAIHLHGEPALPGISLGPDGTELLRIVREAITNARRHSGATNITVDAGGSTDRAVRIDVADDGGWPHRRAAVRGRRSAGIAGMFDRAERLGATLRIAHRKGGGTRVTIELPLAGRPFRIQERPVDGAG
jgi:PAS domain S-box-containing protein